MGASSVQRLRAVTGGACGPCSCSPHPPWPSTMRRSGRYCSVGAGGRHAPCRDGARVGDPPGFRLDACRTQRNLSAAGREQARRLGAAGRHVGAHCAGALETVVSLPGDRPPGVWHGRALVAPRSLFQDRRREAAQTTPVRQRVGERPMTGNLILVTHQVNITALTGIAPAAGEMVILTPQGDSTFRLAGRLPPTAFVAP